MRHRLILIMTLAAPLGATPLLASPAASGFLEIEAPAPKPGPAPTAGRSFLCAAELAASGVDTIAAALELLPGISVSSNGASGAQAAASVRGSTGNQVLVLVDGSPVSDPSTGLTDFSRLGLAPSDVESIEVVKGGASAQFGADAVGGVVIISTKRTKPARPAIDIDIANTSRIPFSYMVGSGFAAVAHPATFGSLADGQEAALRLSLPNGLIVGLGGERAENAYLYRDANGVKRSRDNAGLLAGRGLASWSTGLGPGRFDASFGGSIRRLEVPGSSSSPTPSAAEEDGVARGALHFATDSFLSDRLSLDASSHGLFSMIRYRENEGSTGDTNASSRAGADLRLSMLAGESFVFGAGLSGRYESLASSNVTNSRGESPERVGAGAYVEPVFRRGIWMIAPAARFDWTSDYEAGFSFSLGAACKVSPRATLSANASTAYRAPSFDDLYWPASSGVAGNPSLKPESGMGGDLGLSFAKDGFEASSSVFVRYAQDVILWQPGSDSVWRPSNYGKALYPGLELELKSPSAGPFSSKLSYTYIHSYIMSGGMGLAEDLRVPMVPEHAFSAGLSYGKAKLQASIDFAYTGLRYYKMANIAYDPAHLVVNAHARLVLRDSSSISVDANNLLDERYESVQGYPMPGFSLRAGFSLRL